MLERIRAACDAGNNVPLSACISIYVALCDEASRAGGDEIKIGVRGIASLSGVSERQAQKVLPMLRDLGVIHIQQNPIEGTKALGWSTYTLLSLHHPGAPDAPPSRTGCATLVQTESKSFAGNVCKEPKESKEQIKEPSKEPLQRTPNDDDEDGFDSFWESYPKKRNRAEAKAIWDKAGCSMLQAEIAEGLRRWNGSTDWSKENGKFIPQPARWLEDERWKESPRDKGKGHGLYAENIPLPPDIDYSTDLDQPDLVAERIPREKE